MLRIGTKTLSIGDERDFIVTSERSKRLCIGAKEPPAEDPRFESGSGWQRLHCWFAEHCLRQCCVGIFVYTQSANAHDRIVCRGCTNVVAICYVYPALIFRAMLLVFQLI